MYLGDEVVQAIVIPKTIGQYTRRRTDEGTKIFEGDLFNHNGLILQIMRKGTGFAPYKRQNSDEFNRIASWSLIERLEPVGNIHDNSELLEEGR